MTHVLEDGLEGTVVNVLRTLGLLDNVTDV